MATQEVLSVLRKGSDRSRVTNIELFFDLVFVFLVTQLSHTLLDELTVLGALRVGVLFLAVWWLWTFTAWCTNWVEPDHPRVRLMLFALMLGGLLLSSALPHAFDSRGLIFACVFAAMQIGRSLFMVFCFGGIGNAHGRNFLRITLWMCASGALWISGGLADPAHRLLWWAAALLVEYAGPAAYFFVPGLGRSHTAEWDVNPHHLAERCSAFVLIALGESLVVTGATFAELEWDPMHVAAFVIDFIGAVAMWWLYFDTGMHRAVDHFSKASDPGKVARLAYTYLHLLIIAGIIVSAVADELVLTHPEHASSAAVTALLGGPALYLSGNALFKWVTNRRPTPPLSHVAALVALALLAPFAFGHHMSTLAIGAWTTAIVAGAALWETIALRRQPASTQARAH